MNDDKLLGCLFLSLGIAAAFVMAVLVAVNEFGEIKQMCNVDCLIMKIALSAIVFGICLVLMVFIWNLHFDFGECAEEKNVQKKEMTVKVEKLTEESKYKVSFDD